jgi:hypothetical protein
MRESDDEPVDMSGYVVDLLGAKYLNGKLDSQSGFGASGWVLLRYWFEVPNRLVVAQVDSQGLAGCDAGSAVALYGCLRQRPIDPKYFTDTSTYERVSLVATQPNNGSQRTAGAHVRGKRSRTTARRR